MKFAEMREVFEKELSFLQSITEYESGLEQISNMKDAITNIEGWKNDGYEDLPESFLTATGPSILMAVWNTFIVPDEKTKEAIHREEYDEQFKKDHPDWLAFDCYYADGSTLFIDPEFLIEILGRIHHYDAQHCEVIKNALVAYHNSYMENL